MPLKPVSIFGSNPAKTEPEVEVMLRLHPAGNSVQLTFKKPDGEISMPVEFEVQPVQPDYTGGYHLRFWISKKGLVELENAGDYKIFTYSLDEIPTL